MGEGLGTDFHDLLKLFAILRPDDESDAVLRSALTRVILPMFQCVSVIECQLIAFGYFRKGDEPNLTFDVLGFAIGIAGVVGEPSDIPVEVAVEVVLVVEVEDVDGAFAGELRRLELV